MMNAHAGAGALYDAPLTTRVLALAAGITAAAAGGVYGGWPLGAGVLSAAAIAMFGWIASERVPGGTGASAFNIYIAALVAVMAFYAEEWMGDFPAAIARLFPQSFPPGTGLSRHAYVAVFPLGTMAFFVLGALAYYHRLAIGRFAAWAVFSWGAVIALGAYGFPLLGEPPFGYMPGMVTAPIVLVVALWGMRRLAREERLGAADVEGAP